MCVALEEIVKDSRKEGHDKAIRDSIKDMLRRGKSVDEIVDFCAYDRSLVNEVKKSM